jgi:hypothetical protein
VCVAHPRPARVWPVRVMAGAFAPGVPARDLDLSPDHAVWAEGVLIPVRCLVNGNTVRQMRVAAVTYFHVELDRHDVVLAEALPVESYLDSGNRAAFAGGVMQMHPAFGPGVDELVWEAASCAPLRVTGIEVERARAALRKGHEDGQDRDRVGRAARGRAGAGGGALLAARR